MTDLHQNDTLENNERQEIYTGYVLLLFTFTSSIFGK